MKVTPQEIFAAKKARRRRLAALPVIERLRLIDKLHEFGLEMRKIKCETHPMAVHL